MQVNNKKTSQIGDLVWIPANTPLLTRLEPEFIFNSTEKKEPMYGLVISHNEHSYRVLIGNEEFYVQKKQVYGVENDY